MYCAPEQRWCRSANQAAPLLEGWDAGVQCCWVVGVQCSADRQPGILQQTSTPLFLPRGRAEEAIATAGAVPEEKVHCPVVAPLIHTFMESCE